MALHAAVQYGGAVGSRAPAAPELRIPAWRGRGGGEPQAAAWNIVNAVLQLFDLCPPQEDAMIRIADIQGVLQKHVGEASGIEVRGLFSPAEGSGPELLDFLSYWHGMDRFFAQARVGPEGLRPRGAGGRTDALGGMRDLRDGVLALWRQRAPSGDIPPHELLDLLAGVQADSEEPQFWGEVMRTVPHGGGQTLRGLARAVCAWLRSHVPGRERAASPRDCARRRSLSAGARLSVGGSEAGSSPAGTPTPWADGAAALDRGHRRSSLLLEGAQTPAVDVLQATECLDFLQRSLDPGNHAAQQAQKQLQASLRSLSRALQRQETEMSGLRSSNAALGKKKSTLEEELGQVREFQEDVRELQEQRDEQRRRAESLEHELLRLREQHLYTSEELERLRSETADVQRRRADSERRDGRWRDRCSELEEAADTAEGQARWMREEFERQRSRAAALEAQQEASSKEIARLRQSLEEASGAIRGHAAYAAECEESIKDLRRQLSSAASNAGARAFPDEALRAELESLRSARDELLRVRSGRLESPEAEDAAESPRGLQRQRRCRFLELQLQALLRHTQSVESIIETHCESEQGSSPDSKRQLSIQQVQRHGEAFFGDLSERLHTLEVQKEDADQEVQRLQGRVQGLARELSILRQSREELLLEMSPEKHATALHDELGARLKGSARGAGSATSETRSVSSASVALGADAGGFLPQAQGPLQPSPKLKFQSGVSKVVNANTLGSAPATHDASAEPGRRHRKGHERRAEEPQRRSEHKHRGTGKPNGECKMQ